MPETEGPAMSVWAAEGGNLLLNQDGSVWEEVLMNKRAGVEASSMFS